MASFFADTICGSIAAGQDISTGVTVDLPVIGQDIASAFTGQPTGTFAPTASPVECENIITFVFYAVIVVLSCCCFCACIVAPLVFCCTPLVKFCKCCIVPACAACCAATKRGKEDRVKKDDDNERILARLRETGTDTILFDEPIYETAQKYYQHVPTDEKHPPPGVGRDRMSRGEYNV